MSQHKLEALQKEMFFTGFGESLNPQLEEMIKSGKPEFTLNTARKFGDDDMEAVLHFKKSKENYYFNSYEATLKAEGGDRSFKVYINSLGQSITFKESCNLLNGRPVYKELAKRPGEGQEIVNAEDIQTYKTWLQLDLTKKDEKGQFIMNRFHDKYGFHLEKELIKSGLNEMNYPKSKQILIDSLMKGNPTIGTLINDNGQSKVSIVAVPEKRELMFHDEKGNKLDLAVKSPKIQNKLDNEKPSKKKELLNKNREGNGLLKKMNQSRKRGQAIS